MVTYPRVKLAESDSRDAVKGEGKDMLNASIGLYHCTEISSPATREVTSISSQSARQTNKKTYHEMDLSAF